jgi:undecaprenyl diphosphate synthase
MTPLHVAIIMDGNGRWAERRGLARGAGHRAGAEAVRRTVRAAPALGIGTLTLFAFSSDNWRRPATEVDLLMSLVGEFIRRETASCVENGIRVSMIGRRDRLARALRRSLAHAETATARGARLHLRIALDYSSREAIARAARRLSAAPDTSLETFGRLVSGACLDGPPVHEVDLVIRTGGEQRLSDFLLWECAYAELYFTDRMWPAFDETALREALDAFRSRERRFGGLATSDVEALQAERRHASR